MCQLIFGITGATGTGKSTISDIFRSLGADVIDADKISREVTVPYSDCLAEIERHFGGSVITQSGELDRRALGRIVFSDENELRMLTEITHKYIKEAVEKRIRESISNICAIDGAVLIGSNMESICEFMVVAAADWDIRKNRIMQRDGISAEDAENRMKSQESMDFYIAHADYVIENNKGKAELEEKAKSIYNEILRERGAGL